MLQYDIILILFFVSEYRMRLNYKFSQTFYYQLNSFVGKKPLWLSSLSLCCLSDPINFNEILAKATSDNGKGILLLPKVMVWF